MLTSVSDLISQATRSLYTYIVELHEPLTVFITCVVKPLRTMVTIVASAVSSAVVQA